MTEVVWVNALLLRLSGHRHEFEERVLTIGVTYFGVDVKDLKRNEANELSDV